MFLAKVTAVRTDERYLDEKGKFDLNRAGLLAYSHGEYLSLGKKLGTFGCSVKKKASSKGRKKQKSEAAKTGGRVHRKRMKTRRTGEK